jgi:hypothetical protein
VGSFVLTGDNGEFSAVGRLRWFPEEGDIGVEFRVGSDGGGGRVERGGRLSGG